MLFLLEVGRNTRWWTLISSIGTQAVVLYSPDLQNYIKGPIKGLFILESGENMYYDLLKYNSEIDLSKYSLKDLALYFERYDGYVCKITTENKIIKFKLDVSTLPHLIGLQHAFKGMKNKNDYKGITGFNKMKNGELTYNSIMKAIKNNKSNITWKNIKERIKFLPMFLNKIENSKLKKRDNQLIARHTYMNGSYFLYKNLHNNHYPMFSLKCINNERFVLETFIVENDISLLGALSEEKIKSIELISPLDITSPIIINKKITSNEIKITE